MYERVPHITLRAIANNTEIDVIWEAAQEDLEPLREGLNRVLGVSWEEWEIPRDADETWPDEAKSLHAQWWERRIARQKEIDASIAAKADYEYLYDKPYEDSGQGARRRPLHRREHLPPPNAGGGRERRYVSTVLRSRERPTVKGTTSARPSWRT